MHIIGLTGGIGSGKSTVASIFSELGVPVLDTDDVAREVVQPGSEALKEIVKHFGVHLLTDNGELDRSQLRQLIFQHPEMRSALENITHPRIEERVLQWVKEQNHPYCIIVVPLLFEKAWDKTVERILVVDVPEAMQIQRASQRDSANDESVQKIIDAQIPRSERNKRADDIIDNTGDIASLYHQVKQLHEKYLSLE